jgi:hypothetical protein
MRVCPRLPDLELPCEWNVKAKVLSGVTDGLSCGSGDGEQQVTKRCRGADARGAVGPPAFRSYFAKPLSALQAHALDDSGIKARRANAPVQFGKLDVVSEQQRRLAGVVAIAPLLDAARPPALEVGVDPASLPQRLVQSKMRPSVAPPRMLQDAAPLAYSGKRSLKAAAVIALDLADARSFDEQRLSGPQLAPPLARRMTNHGVRSRIKAGVAGFIPRIDAGQAVVAPAVLDVEGSDPTHQDEN